MREEIEAAHDHIRYHAAQRGRPLAKGFALVDIAAICHLSVEYGPTIVPVLGGACAC